MAIFIVRLGNTSSIVYSANVSIYFRNTFFNKFLFEGLYTVYIALKIHR